MSDRLHGVFYFCRIQKKSADLSEVQFPELQLLHPDLHLDSEKVVCSTCSFPFHL